MTDLSRRAALVGASAFAGSVVNLAAVVAARPEDHPDAELIQLYGELVKLDGEDRAINLRIEPLQDRFYEIVNHLATLGGVPDDQTKWTREHAQIYVACLGEAERQYPDFYNASEESDAHWVKVAAVMDKIMALPARTIAGLQAKAFAVMTANRQMFAYKGGEFENVDWEKRYIIDLVQSIAAAHYGAVRRAETEEQDAVLVRA